MTTTMNGANPSFFQVAKRWSTLLLVGGTLLIILSSIGFWVQWFMLSEDSFVNLTDHVISNTDSRDAISEGVIDRLLADFPILRALVRDPLEAVVSAILGSSIFATALEFIATRIWETLFVNGGQVVINLEPLQDFLYGVISAIAPNLAANLNADQFPDELVLLDPGDLPDLERISNLVAWTTWITLLAGLGLLGFAISRVWSQSLVRYAVIAWTGIFLIIEAIIVAILTIPTRSTVVLAIEGPTGRKVVGTTYDMLAQRLHGILLVVALIGVVLGAIGLWKRRAITRVTEVPEVSLSGSIVPEPQPGLAGSE